MKPLLAYWHAVDLREVVEPFNDINCDKLILSYFPYPYPHRIIEDFFKIHTEYTHLILMPNDLVVTPGIFEAICEMGKKYDACCGVANVDMNRHRHHFNVCWNLPILGPYQKRNYRWVAQSTADLMIENGGPIEKVKFAGFPLMCISRKVMEKTRINWLSDQIRGENKALWETSGGYSNDLAFCYNLDRMGVDIYCDFRIRMLHLRYMGVSQVGKKPPRLYFIKDGFLTNLCPKKESLELLQKPAKGENEQPLEPV